MNTWDDVKRQYNLKAHGIDFAGLEGFFGDLLPHEDARVALEEPFDRLRANGNCHGV